MKMKPFFTFWQIGTSGTTVREGSESNSKWKKIYMQISVLSFTLGYDPKLGISQHLRTRYIFFAARGK